MKCLCHLTVHGFELKRANLTTSTIDILKSLVACSITYSSIIFTRSRLECYQYLLFDSLRNCWKCSKFTHFYSTVWFSVPHIFLNYKKTFVRSHEMHNEMNGKISKEI